MHVGWAIDEDVAAVAEVLAEAAAFMRARTSSRWAWRADEIGRSFVRQRLLADELIVARAEGQVVGAATLQWRDVEFWPDRDDNQAGYLHKLAVRRRWAGAGVPKRLIDFAALQVRKQGREFLRLDCHPGIRRLYEALGFGEVDEVRLGPEYVVARFERSV